MQVKLYWISGVEAGRLGIMPRPRGGEWLEDEILSLKASGVDVVVSLLEKEEIAELDIAAEQILCEANGILFFSFPIVDRNVPPSRRDVLDFVQTLTSILQSGKS